MSCTGGTYTCCTRLRHGKNYCHAAGGHQIQNSVGSKAEEPVTEEQTVGSMKKIKKRMNSSLCGDQMLCMRVPGHFDKDDEEEKQMVATLGVGREG